MKLNATILSVGSALLSAGAAFAQPAIFTDLGDHALAHNSGSVSVTAAAGGAVTWFKMRLPNVSAAQGFADFWTNGPGSWTDTEVGVYDNAGALKASDDDDGHGLATALSFGRTSSPRALPPGVAPFGGTDGQAGNGRDGALLFGDYWIAVGAFNMEFLASNWTVTGGGSAGSTTLFWNIELGLPGTPPIGVGSNVTMLPGSSGIITVTVTPGANPASSGITVSANTSSVGGGVNTAMFDDGVTGGDRVANDLVFTTTITAPAIEGNYGVPFVVADALTRSSNGSLSVIATTPPSWNEATDAGSLTASAQIPIGSGSLDSIDGSVGATGDNADIYRIEICDAVAFTASTNHIRTGTQDTQLFLFDSTGHGVQMNDDGAGVGMNSLMHNEFVTATGTYYIALSHWDVDPLNADSQEIWADSPFGTVRAPDGPGLPDTLLAGWGGQSNFAGNFAYRIRFTGACFPVGGCAADFNGDDVVDFFDYLDFVQAFSNNDPSADFNHDSVIDFFDYLDFVQAFSAGC